jgi:hypothetical protein
VPTSGLLKPLDLVAQVRRRLLWSHFPSSTRQSDPLLFYLHRRWRTRKNGTRRPMSFLATSTRRRRHACRILWLSLDVSRRVRPLAAVGMSGTTLLTDKIKTRLATKQVELRDLQYDQDTLMANFKKMKEEGKFQSWTGESFSAASSSFVV